MQNCNVKKMCWWHIFSVSRTAMRAGLVKGEMKFKKTQYYNLNQWEATDPIRREDFNADNAAIDEALSACGNCKIASGSYVGTGTYGSGSPTKITFPFAPKWVYIMLSTAPQLRAVYVDGARYMTTQANGANSSTVVCSLSGTTLNWYNTSDASGQLNYSGYSYFWVAIG